MKLHFFIGLSITSLLLFSCISLQTIKKAPKNLKTVQAGYQTLQSYNKNKLTFTKPVKVVYFYGKDKQPLPNFEERLNRVLNDVSNYYKEQFLRFGIAIDGIPFERKEGKIVFHKVKGDQISLNYNRDSANKIEEEIYRKAKGKIVPIRENILVINALSYKDSDGTYVLHSPFVSFSDRGTCHASDCELIDTKFLKDTNTTVIFSEKDTNRQHLQFPVSKFNSWFIGGIAHELGHSFGLPHDFGCPQEFDSTSLSLMGNNGSVHYRDYLWGGKKSSQISSAGIFQLMSNPLFTKIKQDQNDEINFKLETINAFNKSGKVILNTKFKSDKKPYGIICFLQREYSSEYLNKSFINVISQSNSATLTLNDSFPEGNYKLLFTYLFPNGKTVKHSRLMLIKDGVIQLKKPEAVKAKIDTNNAIYLYKKLKHSKQTDAVKTKLEILENIMHPKAPIDLTKTTRQELCLSDAMWKEATVGWEYVTRNYYPPFSESQFYLQLQDKIYKKGLYAHSPSTFVFNTNKKWRTFSAKVGLRDGAESIGSAIFIVIGDQKVLYKSNALRVRQSKDINIDISNVKTLKLITKSAEKHNDYSWSIWVNPMIKK